MPINRYEKVSAALSLDNSMDWGIINADSSRVVEFIEYVNQENLPQYIQYGFVELIFCSMNEYLLQNQNCFDEVVRDKIVRDKFDEYLEQVLFDDKYYPMATYWLKDLRGEFVLGSYLLEYAGGRQIKS